MSTKELHFQIDHIRYRKEDTDWCVLVAQTLGQKQRRTIIVTGVFVPVRAGMVLRSTGSWREHPTFGKQWVSQSYVEEDPADRASLVKFLHGVVFKDIKGVGLRSAQKVVDHLKERTLAVLDNSPEELTQIRGFSKKRIKQITDVWHQHRHTRHVILHLCAHGISLTQSRKILQVLPSDTLGALKEDPYGLIDLISGFGFRTVDGLFLSLGGDPESPERVAAAILYLLKRARDHYGHSFLGQGQILQSLPTLLSLEPAAIMKQAPQVFDGLRSRSEVLTLQGFYNEQGDFLQCKPAEDSGSTARAITLCYLSSLYHCELSVAQYLRQLLSRQRRPTDAQQLSVWLEEAQKLWGGKLTEQQKIGVCQGISEPLSILTGGAGVGKTTALKAVLFVAQRLDLKIALASPTGRAAQRMKEVTGQSSQTLHRLLEWSPEEGGFLRNETRPLRVDLVIVDESSMIDLYLIRALLTALSSTTQLMLIGDPHQLPSVSVGTVLADMIASKIIPHTILTEIFRQAASSPIIQTASEVQQQKLPSCFKSPYSASSQLQSHQDHVLYIPASRPEKIQDLIIQTITQTLSYLDPLVDIQVLTPVNKGPLGCDALNSKLQHLFHPEEASSITAAETKQERLFFVGDKVIQTVNDYDLTVFNGDIGVVEHVQRSKNGPITGLEVSFPTHQSSRTVSFQADHLTHLRLAYAITIHKSQGSEFPAVIIPLSPAHHIMLGKNLIYTAITRARHAVVLIGEARALERSLKKPAFPPRFSRLRQLISQQDEEWN